MNIRDLLRGLGAVGVASSILVGCDKSTPAPVINPPTTPPTTPAPTAKASLTGHDWYLVNIEFVTGSSTYARAPKVCYQDDILRFTQDNRAEHLANSRRCTSGDVDLQATWTLLANDTRLSLSWASSTNDYLPAGEYDILALTATEIRIAKANVANPSTREIYTFSPAALNPPALWQQRQDLLMGKRWRMTAYVTTSNQTATDEYARLTACQRDNFLQFNPTQTIVNDEGATKCNPADPQTQTGGWGMSDDGYSLGAPGAVLGVAIPQNAPMTIVELSATTLSLRWSAYNQGYGGSTTVTYTAF
ncbi:hypothetical protein LJ737_01195 [Hymenobacter sp. 15J16-1T3B]|uniref:hypothetical protein n=1 Tax=Hymenobacter sp. 15J16-1T3B TaxID=2886941 RepID=UPI001D10C3ED|nr:hypothetical protein [Hymenobacter sp. 15J16-1T3B]MCC3155833.1 hypothetical protein [Hymenobacter sp. 15J16-1T3B]